MTEIDEQIGVSHCVMGNKRCASETADYQFLQVTWWSHADRFCFYLKLLYR